jgi:hypothetical protein
MMLQLLDHGLDITSDAAELARRLSMRRKRCSAGTLTAQAALFLA